MKVMIEVVDLLIKKVREVLTMYCTVQYKESARGHSCRSFSYGMTH